MKKISLLKTVGFISLFALVFLVFPGADSLASEGAAAGEHEGGSWTDLMWRAVNFTFLAGALYFLLAKLTRKFFTDRRESIEKELEEARMAKEAAEKKLNEISAKLGNLEAERDGILSKLRKEGEKERERIISEALKAAERITRQAELTADQEVKKTVFALRKEAASFVVNLAEETLKREMGKKDQERLAKVYLKELSDKRGFSAL